MIRLAMIAVTCSLFTACMTAQDQIVLQEAKDIMALGPKKAIASEKAPEVVPSESEAPKDSEKVETKVENKSVDR